MTILAWTPRAWEDYLFWQRHDPKTLRRVNELIRDILRSPFEGIGKPEALRYDLVGHWSRRIDAEHRLVYRYEVDEERVVIVQCRFHY